MAGSPGSLYLYWGRVKGMVLSPVFNTELSNLSRLSEFFRKVPVMLDFISQ